LLISTTLALGNIYPIMPLFTNQFHSQPEHPSESDWQNL